MLKKKNSETRNTGLAKKHFIPALGFGWLTGIYDLVIRFTMPEDAFRKRLVQCVNPLPNENILEFGFGTGENLKRIIRHEPKGIYEGVDIDPKIEKLAQLKLRKLNIDIPLRIYDGRKLPYGDSQFSTVFTCLVFHHLDRAAKISAMREIHRVLAPGGRLVVGDWGKPSSIWMRWAFLIVQCVDGFKTTSDNAKGLIPVFLRKSGYKRIRNIASMNSMIGTFTFYEAKK